MYPLSKLREQKWDQNWTVISYDISKNHVLRNLLRKLVKDYGFGKLHQSLYLSPLNVSVGMAEFFENKNLLESVSVFRSCNILGLADEQLANKIYNINKLNLLYKDLFKNYSEHMSAKDLEVWKDYYIAVNYFDPYLPYELLPSDWYGDNCFKAFKNKQTLIKILKSIAKKTMHHPTLKLRRADVQQKISNAK